MFAKVRSTIPSSAAASVEIWMWREYSASMSKVFCEGHGVFGEK
jgi:hypothetical protein